jgi:hypothetical protein
MWHKRMLNRHYFRNEHGNTLIQVMITSAIMIVVALGASSMIVNQNREVQGVADRLRIAELQTLMTQTLSNATFCSCLFRGRTFNSVTNQWSPDITSIPSSYTVAPAFPNACTESTNAIVPPAGNNIPGSGVIKVANLNITDTTEIVAGSGNYSAKILVSFDGTIRAVRGAQTTFVFNVDPNAGSATARPFISCSGSAGSVTLNNCQWTAFSCAPQCPANKVAVALWSMPIGNEDCGGVNNDFDEPSRKLKCCDLQF